MRYISVFSGIEAASVAWGPLGWEPVAFSEIDPFPSAVLAERFPGVPNLGDITQIDWSQIGAVDLVVGGSPCQSFSVAGKREGLAGASGLMFEYIRCVRELRPRWFVWENVPGALSSEGGAAFGQLLTEMDDLGYGLAWRVLDAQFFGVAQRRRRVFLVGSLGDGGAERACEVLFEPESLRWDPPSSREKRKALAAGAEGCAGCAGFKYHQGAGAGSIGYIPEQSPTLTADWHNPAVFCMADDNAKTAIDADCIEHRPAMTTYAIRMRSGKPGGGKGALVQTEVSGTLATGNDQTIICMTDTQPNSMVDGETCGTLSCHSMKDPPVITYAIDRATTPKFSEDVCHTLRHGGSGVCNDAVAFSQNTRDEVRYVNGGGAISGALAANPGMKQTSYVKEGAVVRRLTPRECERLQGFPDDWTLIDWNGKPAPDGRRYKAIGNSMAVPVMRWIGERIELADVGK